MPVINRPKTRKAKTTPTLLLTYTIPCLNAPECDFQSVRLDATAAHEAMRRHYLSKHLKAA